MLISLTLNTITSCSYTINTRIRYSTWYIISYICIIDARTFCTQLFHVE